MSANFHVVYLPSVLEASPVILPVFPMYVSLHASTAIGKSLPFVHSPVRGYITVSSEQADFSDILVGNVHHSDLVMLLCLRNAAPNSCTHGIKDKWKAKCYFTLPRDVAGYSCRSVTLHSE